MYVVHASFPSWLVTYLHVRARYFNRRTFSSLYVLFCFLLGVLTLIKALSGMALCLVLPGARDFTRQSCWFLRLDMATPMDNRNLARLGIYFSLMNFIFSFRISKFPSCSLVPLGRIVLIPFNWENISSIFPALLCVLCFSFPTLPEPKGMYVFCSCVDTKTLSGTPEDLNLGQFPLSGWSTRSWIDPLYPLYSCFWAQVRN